MPNNSKCKKAWPCVGLLFFWLPQGGIFWGAFCGFAARKNDTLYGSVGFGVFYFIAHHARRHHRRRFFLSSVFNGFYFLPPHFSIFSIWLFLIKFVLFVSIPLPASISAIFPFFPYLVLFGSQKKVINILFFRRYPATRFAFRPFFLSFCRPFSTSLFIGVSAVFWGGFSVCFGGWLFGCFGVFLVLVVFLFCFVFDCFSYYFFVGGFGMVFVVVIVEWLFGSLGSCAVGLLVGLWWFFLPFVFGVVFIVCFLLFFLFDF